MESTTVCTTLCILAYLAMYVFTAKAETDYWNSHSQAYRQRVWIMILIGLIPFSWFFYAYCRGVNAHVPTLVLLDYISACLIMTGFSQLNEQSCVSKNFSEFWLFGFFKADDYIKNIIWGFIGLFFCTYSLIQPATGALADTKHTIATTAAAQTSVVQHKKSTHAKKIAPAKSHRIHQARSSQA